MGRMYVAEFADVAVSAAQDFFELTPATNRPIVIHAVYLSQNSDVGDAAEEMLTVKIIRGHATSGSGGSTQTPTPLIALDTASGITSAELNNTTIASSGTAVDLHSEAFNIRAGWVYMPTPEMRPHCTAAGVRIVVRLLTTPADSLTMSGTIYFEEPF